MTVRNLSLLIAVPMILFVGSAASAQEDSSQRLLPLPDDGVQGMAQHRELLKKLRSLIESGQQTKPQPSVPSPSVPSSGSTSPDPSSPQTTDQRANKPQQETPPKIPTEQLQKFQDAIKNLTDKLPPGIVPPNLGSMPPEQLRKNLENPAVQQQMKEMLQQFSKDGLLPPPGSDGSPLPLPPRNEPAPRNEQPPRPGQPPRSQQTPKAEQPDDSLPEQSSGTDPDAPAPPKSVNSLRDFLNKLAEGTPPSSSNNAKQPGSEPQAGTAEDPPSPKQPLRRKDRRRKSSSNPAGDAPNVPPSTIPPSTVPTPGTPSPTIPSAPADPENSNNPGASSPNSSPSAKPNEPRMEPGRSGQNSQPSSEPNPSGSLPQNRPVPNPLFPPNRQAPDSDSGITPEPKANSNLNPGSNSNPGLMPQTNELKLQDLQQAIEQLKELAEKSGTLSTDENSPGTIPNGAPSFSPTPTPANPNRRSSDMIDPAATNPKAPSASASPTPPVKNTPEQNPQAIDVQKELEQKGFGETLKKIVERAKQESLQPKPPSEATAGTEGSQGMNGQTSPELSKSMINMLDGLKDDLVEIAKDAKFNDRPQPREENLGQQRETPSASGSTIEEWKKAASEFLAAPENRAIKQSATNPAAASGGSVFDSQFDLTPVLMLAAILAAAGMGFFGMRYLKLRTADSMALQLAGPPIQPSEIRNRADVVRAFHEFSLRSTKKVQAWWTHRAVERVIVESSPEKKAAVEALANAYEQARYLPQDHELSFEQIQAARNALQQCTVGVSAS